MNKLITLLIAFFILTSISGLGTAAEIFVQPGNSIQTAVNSASSGDIITVKSGTYTENIKITKGNLTIRSESGKPDNTILQAKSKGASLLLLQGSKIKITGFKIVGAYAGINLSSCNNCVIENNIFLDNSRGIYLLRSSGNTVSRNNVANSGEYGIALQNSMSNTISGNMASNNDRGVYFGSSDDNTFSGNTVRNNKIYGIFVCGLSDRNLIYNNYFNDTTITIRNGVGNSYNITKRAGTNIVSGPHIGGNFWGKPDGKGFSDTAVDKDGDGISDSAYKSITGSKHSDYLPLVVPKPPAPILPVAEFNSNITSGNVPLNVAFTDRSTGSPTSWSWSFGDGTSSTSRNPIHTYSSAGSYTVTLKVSNTAGSNMKTKSSYIKVTAPVQKPVVNFWGSRTSGTAPIIIGFTDASTGSPTAWKWSFGDGTYSTDQNPKHTYSKAGTYTVTLTASNAAGSNIITKSNYIKVTETVQKPVVNFWGSRTSGMAPTNIGFTDASTGSPTAWKWSFGDGTYSTDQNPKHTYSKAGTYTVTLTASNSGGSGTNTRPDYIKVTEAVQKPVVNFWGSRTSGTAPLTIGFTDASTESPTAWKWSFGDGTYSTDQNPKHTYSKARTYTVTLTASNAAGSNIITKSNYIKVTEAVQKPVVNFWGSRTSGMAPLTIGFTDASTESPTAWKWSFGDGTYSTDQNPKHTYSKAGTYTVTLTASNSGGSGTNTRPDYIKVT